MIIKPLPWQTPLDNLDLARNFYSKLKVSEKIVRGVLKHVVLKLNQYYSFETIEIIMMCTAFITRSSIYKWRMDFTVQRNLVLNSPQKLTWSQKGFFWLSIYLIRATHKGITYELPRCPVTLKSDHLLNKKLLHNVVQD